MRYILCLVLAWYVLAVSGCMALLDSAGLLTEEERAERAGRQAWATQMLLMNPQLGYPSPLYLQLMQPDYTAELQHQNMLQWQTMNQVQWQTMQLQRPAPIRW